MATAIKIEVRAIYEDVGVTPSAARITQRDNDVTLAQNQSASRTHFTPSDPMEYITPWGGGAPVSRDLERRGALGWQALERLLVAGDGTAMGLAIFNQLNTRGMRNGSYVNVFPVDPATEITGPVTFKRSWPPQPDDIG